MKFYGRTKEIDILRKIRNNSKGSAQFTVVTGRRRIGKTELIREAFGDSPYLYFFVARRTEKELCESFRNEIETKLGEFIPGEQVKFKDIFKWVLRTACTRPLTLVIDEFQDLRRCDPAIYSEMQREWDEYHNRAKINLIVCGSVNTMMNRIFRDDKEPLYGRETAFLKIAPFPTETLKEILADHTSAAVPDDLLALYALTGGIAKYVALLMDHGAITRDQMIEDMVSEGSLFIEEGKAGLIEEFGKDYGTYFSILSAIACGRTTRKDIENAVGVGDLGGFLQRLEKDYEIIVRRQPLFGKPMAKNLRYRILDNFYLFWFRFIAKYSAAVELGAFGQLREIIRRDWNVFSGFALERYFHAKFAGTGCYTRLGGWWDRRGENEIDLIAENELDRTATFYEVKRNPESISLPALEAKRDAFRRATGEYAGWSLASQGLSLADM